MIEMFSYLSLKVNIQANPWICLTVHSHELITLKILEFFLAHFDLLVANGLKLNVLKDHSDMNLNKLASGLDRPNVQQTLVRWIHIYVHGVCDPARNLYRMIT